MASSSLKFRAADLKNRDKLYINAITSLLILAVYNLTSSHAHWSLLTVLFFGLSEKVISSSA